MDDSQARAAALRLRAEELCRQSSEVIVYTSGLRQDGQQLRQRLHQLHSQRPAPADKIRRLALRHPGAI
jgi:hypothetical protein